MTFHVGQKVVCVDADSADGFWGETEAIYNGRIYTIRRAFLDFVGDRVVWLEEVARDRDSIKMFGPDIGYCVWRFRPVEERKSQTDISIFEKLLDGAGRDLVRAGDGGAA